MITVTPAFESVKAVTAAEVFPLAYRDVYQEIEADARDLADEMSDADREALEDAYWAAMDEATLGRMAGGSRYADLIASGLPPGEPDRGPGWSGPLPTGDGGGHRRWRPRRRRRSPDRGRPKTSRSRSWRRW